MEDLIIKEDINIKSMIYEIKGKQVMLDSDIAKLYEVETKRINEAVKNNPLKFPMRFAFKISENEYLNLKSKNSTSSFSNNYGGSRKGHTVFTEQGIAMLATILKSKVAIETSIAIMDAFVAMRHYIGGNEYRLSNVEYKVIDHDRSIKLLQESFEKLEDAREINEIYFDGKIYDAYSKILDIFSEAKEELIIVDRYTDKTILDMIVNLKCKVILITGKNTKLTYLDIEKYNKTYNNLSIYYDDTFHDRYFVIDRSKIYHSGNSINHLGFRKSSIDVLMDKNIKKTILKDIDSIINIK